MLLIWVMVESFKILTIKFEKLGKPLGNVETGEGWVGLLTWRT